MKLFAWIGKKRGEKPAKRGGGVSREAEAARLMLAARQREMAERVERLSQRMEKGLASLALRIRRSRMARSEVLALEAEQRALLRLLDRVEVAEMDTADLLHEWRDWMRSMRVLDQAVQSGDAAERERIEMVRSELRVRGVVDEQDGAGRGRSADGGGLGANPMGDSLPEWDQYLGERLPVTARFWEGRMKEAQEGGAHEAVIHDLAKRMRKAHGHAKAWQKMQR